VQEEQLYGAWLAHARQATLLKSGPRTLRILHPGALNRQNGPDFSDASFELDGIRYVGQVEMHRRTREWYSHGHHLDGHYRHVVLHIVGPGEKEEPVYHQGSKRSIPSFALPLWAMQPVRSCTPTFAPGSAQTASRLEKLALQRLHWRVRDFSEGLSGCRPQQLFYEKTLAALGFPSNTQAFARLARAVPAYAVRAAIGPAPAAALYLGQAGLLERLSSGACKTLLRRHYGEARACLTQAPLSAEDWVFAAQRPHNHPLRRLACWITWISEYGLETLYKNIQALLEQRAPFSELFKAWQRYLALRPPSFLVRAGLLGAQSGSRNVIGRGRLTEICANVWAPLFMAQARARGSAGFEAYLKAFYLWLPGRPAYSELQDAGWMAQYERFYPAFHHGQAFLQLNRYHCRLGGCASCPLRHIPGAQIDKKIKNN